MEPLTNRDTFESTHVFILLSVRNTLAMVSPNVQYGDLLPVRSVRFPRECWWILHIENCRDLGSNISVFIWCNVIDKNLYKDPRLSCCL